MISPLPSIVMHRLGVGCLMVAVAMFAAAVMVYATGFEPAFFAMMLAFALFTVGIGALAMGRE